MGPRAECRSVPHKLKLANSFLTSDGEATQKLSEISQNLIKEEIFWKIKFKFTYRDDPYEEEMKALKALSSPEALPVHQRPSQSSLDLSKDLVNCDHRDHRTGPDFVPIWKEIQDGTANRQGEK